MEFAPQPNGVLNTKPRAMGAAHIDMAGSAHSMDGDRLDHAHLMDVVDSEVDGVLRVPEEIDAQEEFATVDVNAYAHNKTLAQGMMDLALLTANANQLRYVLETYQRHPYFYPSLIFLLLSIGFQIAVGVGLILNSRYNIEDKKEVCHAEKVSNYTICGIFIITVINVFISAFGVADAPGDK